MPLTFPSHAAAVLPLKRWRPDRWDGTALVIGSTAPDLPYALYPYVDFDAHALPALLWFCLPATLLLTMVARRWAGPVGAHLGLPVPKAAHRWWVTVRSALVGAGSHVLWDSFTHPRSARIWPWLGLDRIAFAGRPWWSVLQLGSTLAGGAVATWLLWRVARDWRRAGFAGIGGPAMADRAAPADRAARGASRRFWTAAGLVAVAGCAALPLLAGSGLSFVLGVRLLVIAGLALLAGAFAGGRMRDDVPVPVAGGR